MLPWSSVGSIPSPKPMLPMTSKNCILHMARKKTEFVHYNRILHKFPCRYRIITLFWIQYGSIPSFQHIGNKCQETWHNGNISKIANLVNQGSPLQQSSAMQWVKACTTSKGPKSGPRHFDGSMDLCDASTSLPESHSTQAEYSNIFKVVTKHREQLHKAIKCILHYLILDQVICVFK